MEIEREKEAYRMFALFCKLCFTDSQQKLVIEN